jgi:hypothetical protein
MASSLMYVMIPSCTAVNSWKVKVDKSSHEKFVAIIDKCLILMLWLNQ